VDQNQRSDERDRPIAGDPSAASSADSPESVTPDLDVREPEAPSRWRRLRRVVRGVVWTVALVVAVAFVTFFSIDLGPSLRGLAERQAANYLKRDFKIGKLSIRLLTGDFVLEQVRIGGVSPGDRAFFTAGRITVDMPWWSIFTRELIVEGVEVRDWRMLVET
jgi:hypothetical protein